MPEREVPVTESTSLPVLAVVDEEPSALGTLVSDLVRRYAADYRVVGESSPQAALDRLGALRDAGDQVALIISRQSMQAMRGSELLARSRSAHPDAKRILLIGYGEERMFHAVPTRLATGHRGHCTPTPRWPLRHLPYAGQRLR